MSLPRLQRAGQADRRPSLTSARDRFPMASPSSNFRTPARIFAYYRLTSGGEQILCPDCARHAGTAAVWQAHEESLTLACAQCHATPLAGRAMADAHRWTAR